MDESGAATYGFYTEGTSAPAVTASASTAALALAPSALYVGALGLVLEPLATASGVKALVDGVAEDVLVTPRSPPSQPRRHLAIARNTSKRSRTAPAEPT